MRCPLVIAVVCLFSIAATNGARLPEDRAYDPVLLENLVSRDFFFINEYPVLLRRHDYAVLDEALAKRAPAGNMPGTGTGITAVGAQKTVQPTDKNMQTFGQSKVQSTTPKDVTGVNQQFGQQKTTGGAGKTMKVVDNNQPPTPTQFGQPKNTTQMNQMNQKPVIPGQTSKKGTTFYDQQNKNTQKQLSEYCDTADTSSDRNEEQLIFTNPKLDHLPSSQVTTTLEKSCYNYQDKVQPQYSEAAGGYYDKKGQEPKNQGTFSGGRIPGTSGSKSVYSASCEIEQIKSPKWFDAEPESVRVTQQHNPNGDDAAFSAQFLNSQGSTPYTGKTKFCHGVP